MAIALPRFGSTADLLPEPMLLVTRTGIIDTINRAFTRTFGWPADMVIGQPLAGIITAGEPLPDYLRRCAGSSHFVFGALTLRHQDGSDVACRAEGAAIGDSGSPGTRVILLRFVRKASAATRFVALTRKIGDLSAEIARRQRAERATALALECLQDSERQFRDLANSMPNLAWMATPDGAIYWFNDQWYAYTGTTAAQVLNGGWQTVHDPQVLPGVLQRWHHSIATGAAFEMVFPLRGTDGTFRRFLTRVNPLRNAHGHVMHWFGTNTDVEGERRAIEMKDEFLAMLGHELRNPLSPILTALQLMKLKAGDNSDHERAVIERQVSHMTRLVDDLFDVSRFARGDVELRLEPIEIADIVSKAVEMMAPALEQHGHSLTMNVPRSGLAVSGDATRLRQVVSNLLANAAKYTPPRGAITIDASSADGDVVLRVRDNGIGISPEVLPRVFELFVQERQALNRAPGGLGLGLAIVRNLVERHGGHVSAHSAGVGRGSEFVIRLPRLDRN